MVDERRGNCTHSGWSKSLINAFADIFKETYSIVSKYDTNDIGKIKISLEIGEDTYLISLDKVWQALADGE